MSYISRNQPLPVEDPPVAIAHPGLVVAVAAIMIFALFGAALWGRPAILTPDELSSYVEIAL